MASNPLNPEILGRPSAEDRLTADERWELILSLAGSAREMYAEVGGSEAWIKAERSAWDEERAV